MTGRRLLVGDAAICPSLFANAYTNDLADGMIGGVADGVIAGGGRHQQQSAASLCQSLSMKLPAHSTDGNARSSQMNSRNARKLECAALPMPVQSTAHLAKKVRPTDKNATAMHYATAVSEMRKVAKLYRQPAAPRAGLPPMSRFLVTGGCLYSERNRQVEPIDYAPGGEAPETGTYEQLDVFRIPTGITEHVIRGERLPLAPQGYKWRKMANDEATSGHSRTNVVRPSPRSFQTRSPLRYR